MKKIIIFICIIALSLTCFGCGNVTSAQTDTQADEQTRETEEDDKERQPQTVVVIATGGTKACCRNRIHETGNRKISRWYTEPVRSCKSSRQSGVIRKMSLMV